MRPDTRDFHPRRCAAGSEEGPSPGPDPGASGSQGWPPIIVRTGDKTSVIEAAHGVCAGPPRPSPLPRRD